MTVQFAILLKGSFSDASGNEMIGYMEDLEALAKTDVRPSDARMRVELANSPLCVALLKSPSWRGDIPCCHTGSGNR
jgi:hypothetical protein